MNPGVKCGLWFIVYIMSLALIAASILAGTWVGVPFFTFAASGALAGFADQWPRI